MEHPTPNLNSTPAPSLAPPAPVETVHLFSGLLGELCALLQGLSPQAWLAPTACTPWTVRDVAAHLLDTDLRQLSILRDGAPLLQPSKPIENHGDLLEFLDTINSQWIVAARRFSYPVLIDLLKHAGSQVAAYYQTLEMQTELPFGVGWAGETRSAQWFHLAREYTEKWHHQQHIRDAVGRPGLLDAVYGAPALATFVRALPHTYRAVDAPPQTAIAFEMTGPAGNGWTLYREAEGWRLYAGLHPNPEAHITIDGDRAWRLFTKGISAQQARIDTTAAGDALLIEPFFSTVSILA